MDVDTALTCLAYGRCTSAEHWMTCYAIVFKMRESGVLERFTRIFLDDPPDLKSAKKMLSLFPGLKFIASLRDLSHDSYDRMSSIRHFKTEIAWEMAIDSRRECFPEAHLSKIAKGVMADAVAEVRSSGSTSEGTMELLRACHVSVERCDRCVAEYLPGMPDDVAEMIVRKCSDVSGLASTCKALRFLCFSVKPTKCVVAAIIDDGSYYVMRRVPYPEILSAKYLADNGH